MKTARYFLKIFVILLAFLCSNACTGSSDSLDSESPVEAPQGTIIGNPPTSSPKLTLKTAVTTSLAECSPFGFDADNNAHTQKCQITPKNYTANITAIYAIECVDENNLPIVCAHDVAFTVSQRVLLSDEDTSVAIDSLGEQITLSTLNEQNITVGGLQLVTPTMGVIFPETGSSSADRVVEHLHGKSFRICMASDVDADSLCQVSGAKRGDVIVDVNDDGVFGFVDVATLSATSVSETTSRPDNYAAFIIEEVLEGSFAFTGNEALEYSDDTFSPIIGLSALLDYSNDANVSYTVTFDISSSFFFIDGIRNTGAEQACIEALSGESCQPDHDPVSAGVYNPAFDGRLFMAAPSATVTAD